MKTQRMNYQNYLPDILFTLGIVCVAIFLALILSVALNIIFANVLTENTSFITSFVSTILSMCIVPYAIMRKKYNVTIRDLGLGRLSLYDYIFVVVTIAVGVTALIIGGASFDLKLLNITLHFLWISIGEEFLSRGCLFYCLRKITKSKWIIITASAFIFAFGLHVGGDLMDNIIIRLPLGFAFAAAYAFTNRLYLPIALHWVYDVAIDYVVLLF